MEGLLVMGGRDREGEEGRSIVLYAGASEHAEHSLMGERGYGGEGGEGCCDVTHPCTIEHDERFPLYALID